MVPEKKFFIRKDGSLSIKEMTEIVGIRSDQFVEDAVNWHYKHLIKESEGIWSDYRDQVHGNGWQVVESAQYEVRHWHVVDGWRIKFSAGARAEDVAQAKVWLEEGPTNKLGVLDAEKTKKYKNRIYAAEREKQEKTTNEFTGRITSHKLWRYVCAVGEAEKLSFNHPLFCNDAEGEKFLVAFQKGEELCEENPVKFYEGKELHLCLSQRFRWTGQTGRQHSWVITPGGEKRIPDNREFGNNGRSDYDGVETWDYILPDELVLVWSKEYTASPHEFEVVHKPANITPGQKEKIKEIEEFVFNEFKNAVGISGKKSPGIGDGFRI